MARKPRPESGVQQAPAPVVSTSVRSTKQSLYPSDPPPMVFTCVAKPRPLYRLVARSIPLSIDAGMVVNHVIIPTFPRYHAATIDTRLELYGTTPLNTKMSCSCIDRASFVPACLFSMYRRLSDDSGSSASGH
jgi:hypothetical protein